MLRAAAVALAALVLAPVAVAGGPTMLVGATADELAQPTLAAAQSGADRATKAGLGAVRITSTWLAGQTAPAPADLAALRNAVTAAGTMRVIVSVYPYGSSQTPLDDASRAAFAAYAAALARALPQVHDFVVGNEPNLNRFWLPQFDEAGGDAAATAYVALLAQTYDALKAVSPLVTVYGGALAPRGVDRPGTGRDTHSPTTFIPDMGAAYRASGRTMPIMDAFAFHPYMDNSSQAPTFVHPNGTTVELPDYGKLVALLARAFDGTAQAGSALPILYDEFGVETAVPPDEAAFYTGAEPRATRAVDARTQALYYAQALQLAYCYPTVMGLLVYHISDEVPLDRWQSGLYYADGTSKASAGTLRAAAAQARRGVLARCSELKLTPQALQLVLPSGRALQARQLAFRLRCDLDCTYRARVVNIARGSTTLATSGRATGGVLTRILFEPTRLARGRYRLELTLTAPVNPGPPGSARGAFRVA